MRVVLIVDGDPDVRDMLALLFAGWRVHVAGTGEGALRAAHAALADGGLHLVVLALRLPDLPTETVYDLLCRRAAAPVPAIVLSGAPDGAERAARMGVPFLPKPDGVADLLELAGRLARPAEGLAIGERPAPSPGHPIY